MFWTELQYYPDCGSETAMQVTLHPSGNATAKTLLSLLILIRESRTRSAPTPLDAPVGADLVRDLFQGLLVFVQAIATQQRSCASILIQVNYFILQLP